MLVMLMLLGMVVHRLNDEFLQIGNPLPTSDSLNGNIDMYPLVNIQKATKNGNRNSGFTH